MGNGCSGSSLLRAIAPLALIASLFGRLNSAKTAYRELDKLMNQMNEDESESSGLMIDKLGELTVLGWIYLSKQFNPKSHRVQCHYKTR